MKSMTLESPAFEPGGAIPVGNTCDGEDLSPALHWSRPPEGTRSFALICDDPDAPSGTWVHWVLFNIAPGADRLDPNMPPREEAAGGAKQGRNDFGRIGYGGPCPPRGKPHRYFFRLYALDTVLDLDAGVTKASVLKAAKEHVLGVGELMGTYRRP